jgi:hypothetical protein
MLAFGNMEGIGIYLVSSCRHSCQLLDCVDAESRGWIRANRILWWDSNNLSVASASHSTPQPRRHIFDNLPTIENAEEELSALCVINSRTCAEPTFQRASLPLPDECITSVSQHCQRPDSARNGDYVVPNLWLMNIE